MEDKSVHCIVLCGGSGTRLWPLSNTKRPKQFHSLQKNQLQPALQGNELVKTFSDDDDDCTTASQTLLQQTVRRALHITKSLDRVHCVCTALYASTVSKQTPGVHLIVETCPKDTAPAIVLAMRHVPTDATVVIMPADHLFDEKEFAQCIVDQAIPCAQKCSSIVTLGIRPSHPATGFGYIEIDSLEHNKNSSSSSNTSNNAHPVVHFHEKPCASIAETYLSGGQHFWNAGVFVALVGTLLNEFMIHCPSLLASDSIAKVSFDRAVMEKSENAHMVIYKGDWSDLGSWSDVYKVNRQTSTERRRSADKSDLNRQENVILGSGSVHCDHTCARNLIYSNSKANVALCNVSDVIVVVADNGDVLVMQNDETSSQNLKRLVEQIKKR